MRHKPISRRDFLGKSSAGIASFAILKDMKKITNWENIQNQGKIIYRELGKTDINLPIVSMGVIRQTMIVIQIFILLKELMRVGRNRYQYHRSLILRQ